MEFIRYKREKRMADRNEVQYTPHIHPAKEEFIFDLSLIKDKKRALI